MVLICSRIENHSVLYSPVSASSQLRFADAPPGISQAVFQTSVCPRRNLSLFPDLSALIVCLELSSSHELSLVLGSLTLTFPVWIPKKELDSLALCHGWYRGGASWPPSPRRCSPAVPWLLVEWSNRESGALHEPLGPKGLEEGCAWGRVP